MNISNKLNKDSGYPQTQVIRIYEPPYEIAASPVVCLINPKKTPIICAFLTFIVVVLDVCIVVWAIYS